MHVPGIPPSAAAHTVQSQKSSHNAQVPKRQHQQQNLNHRDGCKTTGSVGESDETNRQARAPLQPLGQQQLQQQQQGQTQPTQQVQRQKQAVRRRVIFLIRLLENCVR